MIRESISSGSWIRKMFEEGLVLKKQFGAENVYDFSIGNPDIEPPSKFHEVFERMACEDAKGSHGYMPNAGFTDVRDAVAKKISREQGIEVKGDSVVMTVGAAGGLNIALKCLLNPGDEVIVSAPYFVEYGSYAANHGGKVVPVKSLPDFSLDIEGISKALTPRTAVMIINSPNNPTGRIYSEKDLSKLGDCLRAHAEKTGRVVYLISDEPYREIVYGGRTVPSMMKAYENTLVVTSYSKSLSLPGERIGFVAVHPECDDHEFVMAGLVMCNRVLGYVNAPALMQRIVAELTDVTVDVSIYEKRRDVFAAGLRAAGFSFAEPEGAFYIFCKAPIDDDVKFVNYLKEYRILAVPGSGFGGPGYFRLAYCVEDGVIERSIPVFAEAMRNFKG